MTRMMPKPIVGVTTDRIEANVGTEASYLLRSNYVDALRQAGANVLLLPFAPESVPVYATICDGFVVTGSTPGTVGSPARQEFDTAIIECALQANVPILGICNGMQMIGKARGAQLVNAQSGPQSAVDHAPASTATAPAHALKVIKDSMLTRISDQFDLVNSFHHQVLNSDGDFAVTAHAPDGLIEAIEIPGQSFALGVQWHPEYQLTLGDRGIFQAFVAACDQYCQSQSKKGPSRGVKLVH